MSSIRTTAAFSPASWGRLIRRTSRLPQVECSPESHERIFPQKKVGMAPGRATAFALRKSRAGLRRYRATISDTTRSPKFPLRQPNKRTCNRVQSIERNTMQQYKIVDANTPAGVEKKVNDLFADGWELYGALVVSSTERPWFNQAMIKRGTSSPAKPSQSIVAP